MKEHELYVEEKSLIDDFMEQGFVIKKVSENLDGALVDFYHEKKRKIQTLHVKSAEARKYFSTILMQHNKKQQIG